MQQRDLLAPLAVIFDCVFQLLQCPHCVSFIISLQRLQGCNFCAKAYAQLLVPVWRCHRWMQYSKVQSHLSWRDTQSWSDSSNGQGVP